ncbi:hypothetical protein TNCV_2616171 [Trichonephila clavipes]|nr:hypothetical protein TNCV_2616171 [Trichonephila clavipes]
MSSTSLDHGLKLRGPSAKALVWLNRATLIYTHLLDGRLTGCTAVVSYSFEHHICDKTIWFGSTPILRENTLEMVRSLSPLFPFHQSHERTCGSTAIYSTFKPQRHCTFTNIHAFSRILIQALRHSNQRH